MTSNPSVPEAATSVKVPEVARRFHAVCDQVTGSVLCAMVVFGPWAFGTTEPWSIWSMNAGGLLLGALLLSKWAVRSSCGYYPPVWGRAGGEGCPSVPRDSDRAPGLAVRKNERSPGWAAKALAALTAVVLAYCLVSALNARATLTADLLQFNYRKCISWLPHSYDATLSWAAFWRYLALAAMFWAARDWLLLKTRADREHLKQASARSALEGGCFIPRRLKLLLWVVCLNGAFLACEGIAQRALGGTKLLWLVEPGLNKTPDSQFGPYAYRSNAAQLFLLVWPLAVGFWWLLRRRARQDAGQTKAHNHLLACVLVMAVAPLMSLSRAGTVLGGLSVVAALGLLLSSRSRHGKPPWGLIYALGAAALLGLCLEWPQLYSRFRQDSLDSHRFETWRNTWQIIKDFPVFGTGPGTFSSVYGLYRGSIFEEWDAYAHNDWLETLMTFGAVGTVLVLSALGLALASRFVGKGIYLHRLFAGFIYVSLGSCLLYGLADFPFQVYSVLFLFLLECAMLSSLSRAP